MLGGMARHSPASRAVVRVLKDVHAKTGFLTHTSETFLNDVAWVLTEMLRDRGWALVEMGHQPAPVIEAKPKPEKPKARRRRA